jgi:ABC-type sugar transport system ATPase subunit
MTATPTATRTALLSLRGVTKTFGAVNALTDIDLDVAAGEVVAIVGDNGAGKSTLVKVLAGVHQADSGAISFSGSEVAIAGSLLGDPRVIILDEPTAALGVAQTAEVLDLIERLRERGLGVIMISHNMEDVRAVADRIVVLRLGRNNGEFEASTVSSEEVIAAITGATDNVVTRRRDRLQEPSGSRPAASDLDQEDQS